MNPACTVPVMCFKEKKGDDDKAEAKQEEDKLVLTNSRNILYYLAEKYSDVKLYPKAYREAIDAFIGTYYASFSSIGAFLYGHLSRKSPEMREFLISGSYTTKIEKLEQLSSATEGELHELASQKLQRTKKMDLPKFLDEVNLDTVDSSLQVLVDKMEAMLTANEKKNADTKEGCTYLVGNGFSLADIAGIVFCARIHFLKGCSMFGPKVNTYWERMKKRPTVARANVISEWDGSSFHKLFEEFQANKKASPMSNKRKREDVSTAV